MDRGGEEVQEISYLPVTRRPVSTAAVRRGAVDVVWERAERAPTRESRRLIYQERRRRVEEAAAPSGRGNALPLVRSRWGGNGARQVGVGREHRGRAIAGSGRRRWSRGAVEGWRRGVGLAVWDSGRVGDGGVGAGIGVRVRVVGWAFGVRTPDGWAGCLCDYFSAKLRANFGAQARPENTNCPISEARARPEKEARPGPAQVFWVGLGPGCPCPGLSYWSEVSGRTSRHRSGPMR